jgi:hypothetical protein
MSIINRIAVCAVLPLESRSGFTSTRSIPTSFPFFINPVMSSSISANDKPPGSSVPGPWRECRIHDVYVERNVNIPTRRDLCQRGQYPFAMDFL